MLINIIFINALNIACNLLNIFLCEYFICGTVVTYTVTLKDSSDDIRVEGFKFFIRDIRHYILLIYKTYL